MKLACHRNIEPVKKYPMKIPAGIASDGF